MKKATGFAELSALMALALLCGCAPAKGRSIADKDVPEIRVPKATVLRYLGRTARRTEDDDQVEPSRDPFLTQEEEEEVARAEAEARAKALADASQGPTPPHTPKPPRATPPPEIIPPRNPPASVAGLLVGKNPMFFFKDDTYGVGDKFMGEWVVDKVTEERASMHWVKDKAVHASMNFSRSMVFEIRKS